MTREEATNILHGIRAENLNLDNAYTKDKYEALGMAIKALEQEPFINKPCVSSGVCEHDKNKVLDKLRAEIEPKCDRINSLASVLPYTAHREIQELLCEIIDLCKAESEVEDGK